MGLKHAHDDSGRDEAAIVSIVETSKRSCHSRLDVGVVKCVREGCREGGEQR